jgi:hypothetical protein
MRTQVFANQCIDCNGFLFAQSSINCKTNVGAGCS